MAAAGRSNYVIGMRFDDETVIISHGPPHDGQSRVLLPVDASIVHLNPPIVVFGCKCRTIDVILILKSTNYILISLLCFFDLSWRNERKRNMLNTYTPCNTPVRDKLVRLKVTFRHP
jgi:hypothetical protein